MKDRSDYTEARKGLEPKKVVPRHRALMRLLVAGVTKTQACEELGYTVSRVSIIVASPLFKEEMDKMQKDYNEKFVEETAKIEAKRVTNDPTRKMLEEARVKAAKTLEFALSDGRGSVRVMAAKDILDRTGYGKEDMVKVTVEPSQGLIDVLERVDRDKGEGKEDGREKDEGGQGVVVE